MLAFMKVVFNVKQLRKAQHLTQEQLEARSGVHQSVISQVEKGGYDPRLSTLAKLCEGLGVSPHALFDVVREG
jgi:transcriptional regulator with XRE-family HTH domain